MSGTALPGFKNVSTDLLQGGSTRCRIDLSSTGTKPVSSRNNFIRFRNSYASFNIHRRFQLEELVMSAPGTISVSFLNKLCNFQQPALLAPGTSSMSFRNQNLKFQVYQFQEPALSLQEPVLSAVRTTSVSFKNQRYQLHEPVLSAPGTSSVSSIFMKLRHLHEALSSSWSSIS
jgi:hypothetical protein